MTYATHTRIGDLLRLVTLVGVALTASAVSADVNTWTTNGPEGGIVRALAIDPANTLTLYASTWDSGVFKSSDGGGSWRAINNGLSGARVLAIDPSETSTLYAVSEGFGVFKSTNGGENWRAINADLTNVLDLAIDPSAPATIYAAGTGVFKSTDGGDSWTAMGPDRFFSALAIDPSAPATIYAAGFGTGVFKSTDGGRSWEILSRNLNRLAILALAVDPTAPATLYAGTSSNPFDDPPSLGGVYKSTDSGATWTRTLGHSSATAVVITGRGTVYAGTSRGLSRSENHGTTWISYTNLSGSVRAIAIDPSDTATLYTGTNGGGILKSSNGGGSWTAANGGLIASLVSAVAIDPSAPATIYAGTQGGGVSRSSNGGGSWTAINAGLTSPNVNALAIDPSAPATLYAGTWDGVFKSTDGGESWTEINAGLTTFYVRVLALDPVTPSTLYAGTSGGGVFKSSNGGGSWTAVNTGLTDSDVGALAIDPWAPATLYAGTERSGVFESTNGGESWAAISAGLNTNVQALAIDPSAPATLYAGTWDGVFKSINGGASWTAILTLYVNTLAIDPRAPATLYAGTNGSGVFVSNDGGESWAAINDGLTNTEVLALALDPSTPARLHAGTSGGGVFARDLGAPEPPEPCAASATRLCLAGNRYAVDLFAGRRGESATTPGTARSLADRAGYFSLPFVTGDAELPEVIVKVLGHGALGVNGSPVFYTSLTTLPYVLTVTDTVTGARQTYRSDSAQPLCGAVDVAFEPEGVIAPASRFEKSTAGELRLLSGRFSLTLEARHPRTGAVTSGQAIASADRYGFFTFPAFTSDPTLPEVIVKMLDFRSITGTFLLFYTGLTSLDYTLTLTDTVTGSVQTFESPGDYCGAVESLPSESS